MRPMAWNAPGHNCPSAMPTTMHGNTQKVRERSNTLMPWVAGAAGGQEVGVRVDMVNGAESRSGSVAGQVARGALQHGVVQLFVWLVFQ